MARMKEPLPPTGNHNENLLRDSFCTAYIMTNDFTYVKIPVNPNDSIEELSASKAGGLENDELLKSVKAYFQKQASADHPSCEIMAMSVPLAGNGYKAVSLYSSDYPGVAVQDNVRATKLVTACGHTLSKPILGDVFIGRAYDNEEFEWERADFLASDADLTADWCRVARSRGGGGGQGGSASSLSGLVQQQLNMATNDNTSSRGMPHVIAPPAESSLMYGMDGSAAVQESWGSWTQTSEEVEAKLSVPAGTRSKDCKVIFKRNKLSITILQENRLDGKLFAAVIPDECTYTMEDAANGTKDLSVTLTKANEDSTWSFLTEP